MAYVVPILSGVIVAMLVAAIVAWRSMVWMPGRSFGGTPGPLDEHELQVRSDLHRDLTVLAEEIGPRNIAERYEQLVDAAEFLEQSLKDSGYETRRQPFEVEQRVVWNVEAQRVGVSHPKDVIVVGAHYDTVPGSPGANDNGSAVVANLALARAFARFSPHRTVRFVFFVNEEAPYYMTDGMGSLRYARQCQSSAENIIGMISLETIGCYSDQPGTQRYPVALLRHVYPTTANFVAVVGNLRSRRFIHQVIRGLRTADFPSEGMAAPRWMKDIFRSDHAAFWHCGYPALMITDTANFRYPHYHTAEDTVDKIDFESLARLVTALEKSLIGLAGDGAS